MIFKSCFDKVVFSDIEFHIYKKKIEHSVGNVFTRFIFYLRVGIVE